MQCSIGENSHKQGLKHPNANSAYAKKNGCSSLTAHLCASVVRISKMICQCNKSCEWAGIEHIQQTGTLVCRGAVMGRAASGGASAPEPPRATRSQPESIRMRAKTNFLSSARV